MLQVRTTHRRAACKFGHVVHSGSTSRPPWPSTWTACLQCRGSAQPQHLCEVKLQLNMCFAEKIFNLRLMDYSTNQCTYVMLLIYPYYDV